MPVPQRKAIAGPALCALLAAAAVPSWSGIAFAQGEGARYQMERVDGGVLRIDTLTGAIDLCRGIGSAWRCERVVDGPEGAFRGAAGGNEADVKRLEAERDRLLAVLAEIAALAEAAVSDKPTPPGRPGIAFKTRRDIDEAIAVTDYAVRRFRDLVETLSADKPKVQPPDAAR